MGEHDAVGRLVDEVAAGDAAREHADLRDIRERALFVHVLRVAPVGLDDGRLHG
jgi:hypothetical protein